MTLKLATSEDIPVLKDMCLQFIKFSPYSELPVEEDKVELAIRELIRDPNLSVVLLSLDKSENPVGMLAITLGNLPFNDGLVAHEVVWWMNEKERTGRKALELFKAAEYWAAKVGAQYIQFSSLSVSDQGVDNFYERHGYSMTEKAFLRRV